MGGTRGGWERALGGEDEPCYPHGGGESGDIMDRMAECQELLTRVVRI